MSLILIDQMRVEAAELLEYLSKKSRLPPASGRSGGIADGFFF